MEVLCLQEAKLIEAKARNNMYFIEYTVKKPAQEQKHLLSAVALGFNGRSVADNLPCPFGNSISICVLHCCMSRRLCNTTYNHPHSWPLPHAADSILHAQSWLSRHCCKEYCELETVNKRVRCEACITCRYNRLYTVTGQCKESELSQYKGTLQSVLQTFVPPELPPY